MELQEIIDRTVAEYAPLVKASSEAYWEGTTTGSADAFDRYADINKRIAELFSDRKRFGELRRIKESGSVTDSLQSRQLEELYNSFLSRQADKALLDSIIEKETALERRYAAFRAGFRGRRINDNEVEKLLRTSTDSSELQDVWEAHKAVGREVAADILDVVRLRNQLADSLGFTNYHTMSLMLSGEKPRDVELLMNEVDALSKDGFAQLKKEIDGAMAARCGIPESELRPWHYQGRFFQEAPDLYPVDFDKYYKGRDLERLTIDYYRSIGLDVEPMLRRSDLYPREGKNQHAFCIDMDGMGDVRVLCNITDNERWMETMLHEFGHAAYSAGHDANPELPFLLREAAGIFTTEGVAMMFGRLSRNPEWMRLNLGIPAEEAERIAPDCRRSARLSQLVQSRFMQVVYRFEKAMYADPEQDLNALWRSLVERYQLLTYPDGRDEPDWAAKIHIALYPCYYHNYQMGELFASQMHRYIVENITRSGDAAFDSYTGCTEVGRWLTEKVFAPGKLYPWNDMIRKATGEPLTAAWWAKDVQMDINN
ncbi:MAG TPA: M2 family metallopeptidase [Candidatus Coprenecus stercoravium]|uniref:M2 family metallopeptidase n=1 Tax=Candidatus Coprenecus stercoravium TaxID=2840735 RepID=A0A9D2GNZ9_9BACT|nr:M2 family metallopeptidase [Candidatus Coprenecus stercoravium]